MPVSVRIRQRVTAISIAVFIVVFLVVVIRFGAEKANRYFHRGKAFEILANTPSKFRVVGKSTIVDGFDGISIHLIDTQVGDDELFYIGTLEEIVILDLSGTPVGPEGLRQCMSMSELRQLHLARTSLGETVWSVVNHFPNLLVLDVAETRVTGEQIPDSLSLPDLKIFQGDGARITDVGLRKICKACPHLESLSISGTHVSSDASKFLNQLRGLGYLAVSNTDIDDRFIEGLSVALLKNLFVLRVRSTAISDKTIKQLGIGYPQLRIDLGEEGQFDPE